MGYMLGMGSCYSCNNLFTFNPERVPSLIVDGVRQAICRDCIERVNPQRVANGLDPIVPLPGAYEAEEAY